MPRMCDREIMMPLSLFVLPARGKNIPLCRAKDGIEKRYARSPGTYRLIFRFVRRTPGLSGMPYRELTSL